MAVVFGPELGKVTSAGGVVVEVEDVGRPVVVAELVPLVPGVVDSEGAGAAAAAATSPLPQSGTKVFPEQQFSSS